MPTRPTGPWLRKNRGYYMTLRGQDINLFTRDEDAAWIAYHRRMAAEGLQAEPRPPKPAVSVGEILERFSRWAGNHRDALTADHYDQFLDDFAEKRPDLMALPAMSLRPFHVQEWIDHEAHRHWSTTTQNRAASAVKRAYSWALEMGHIEADPIRPLKKAKAQKRHRILTADEWTAIVAACEGHEPLLDILKMQRETGSRPQELRAIEIRHFDRRGGCLRFPPEEAKGELPRVVMLTKIAQEIVRGCIGERDEGFVFIDARGNPWTRHSLHTALRHLQARCKITMDAYSLRHTYATDAIENGVEGITIGVLMGHVDPSMVGRVYQHLEQKPDYLRDAAERAVSRGSPSPAKSSRKAARRPSAKRKAAKKAPAPAVLRPKHPARSKRLADSA